jgi:hypothetical protein
VDWKQHAALHLSLCRAGFEATLREPRVGDPRIHHVRYPDFVADPVGTIEGFYAKAGVPFTAQAGSAMRAWLRDNRADRYGKFEYSSDVIGVDVAALHEEFAEYRERFGLQIERRG